MADSSSSRFRALRWRELTAVLAVGWLCAFTGGGLRAPGEAAAQGAFQRTEIPSSFNPVGSGARALGMGGAFIAVADDATAASWNPGALVQLERPEISAVGAYVHRKDENAFAFHPEAEGPQSVSETKLNYASAAYPFVLLGHNVIVSLNYQHLFNLSREWDFRIVQRKEGHRRDGTVDFDLRGDLYALGAACAVQITPFLSLGFTLNFWEDFLYDNEWLKTVREEQQGTLGTGDAARFRIAASDHYSFAGFNFNAGLLWRVNERLTFGAVFKSPFQGELIHRSRALFVTEFPGTARPPLVNRLESLEDETLDMPLSYGVGIAWRFSDAFTVSADLHRTRWQDFKHTDARGVETSPVSGKPFREARVDATHHARLGAEYLFIEPKWVIPARAGLFYDPAPAEGSPDDYYGFSLGSGLDTDRFSWDVAYQYRYGRDVGGSVLQGLGFSQDVHEHTIYSSLIVYF